MKFSHQSHTPTHYLSKKKSKKMNPSNLLLPEIWKMIFVHAYKSVRMNFSASWKLILSIHLVCKDFHKLMDELHEQDIITRDINDALSYDTLIVKFVIEDRGLGMIERSLKMLSDNHLTFPMRQMKKVMEGRLRVEPDSPGTWVFKKSVGQPTRDKPINIGILTFKYFVTYVLRTAKDRTWHEVCQKYGKATAMGYDMSSVYTLATFRQCSIFDYVTCAMRGFDTFEWSGDEEKAKAELFCACVSVLCDEDCFGAVSNCLEWLYAPNQNGEIPTYNSRQYTLSTRLLSEWFNVNVFTDAVILVHQISQVKMLVGLFVEHIAVRIPLSLKEALRRSWANHLLKWAEKPGFTLETFEVLHPVTKWMCDDSEPEVNELLHRSFRAESNEGKKILSLFGFSNKRPRSEDQEEEEPPH